MHQAKEIDRNACMCDYAYDYLLPLAIVDYEFPELLTYIYIMLIHNYREVSPHIVYISLQRSKNLQLLINGALKLATHAASHSVA